MTWNSLDEKRIFPVERNFAIDRCCIHKLNLNRLRNCSYSVFIPYVDYI